MILQNIFKYIKEGSLILRFKNKIFLIANKRIKDDKKYLIKLYKHTFSTEPNLNNPITFNEKLLWLKLNWRDQKCYDLVDKYKARNYIKKLGYEKYLTKLYGVYNDVTEINFDNLPQKFVIKVTHDSGGVFICKDKNDKKQIKEGIKKIDSHLKKTFSNLYREWPYSKTDPKIIIEEFIDTDDGNSPKDYKFFCFNGEPKFLYVCSERNVNVKFDFFDLNWNWLNVRQLHENAKQHPTKPSNLNEMIELAKKLSTGFPHVRIDLYNENGKIYFGEFTFFHFSGNVKFEPNEYDYKFGQYLNINTIK